QSIGEYFCAFSEVEHELGEAVKVVLSLQENEASDAIVAMLGDFAKKAGLVLTAINDAKNADGSETTKEWKEKAAAVISKAFQCNDDRVRLAHSLLQPSVDGSVHLRRLRVDHGKVKGKEGQKWSHDDFVSKISRLKEVA